jgi:hypothetical protein
MVKEILTTESRQLPATLELAKRILFYRNAWSPGIAVWQTATCSRYRGERPITMFDNQDFDNQDFDDRDSGTFESAILGDGSRR